VLAPMTRRAKRLQIFFVESFRIVVTDERNDVIDFRREGHDPFLKTQTTELVF
jgi:hypothetical protein